MADSGSELGDVQRNAVDLEQPPEKVRTKDGRLVTPIRIVTKNGSVILKDPKTGQNLPGTKLVGGGRRTRVEEQRYYDILAVHCTEEKWAKVCDKAVKQAMQGNRYAREWLADRLLGPVTLRAQLAIKSETVGVIGWMEKLQEAVGQGKDIIDGEVAYMEPEESNV